MKKNILVMVFFGLVFVGGANWVQAKSASKTVGKATAQKRQKSSSDLKSAREQVELFMVLAGFEKRHGTAYKFEGEEAAWFKRFQRDFNLIPRTEAYVEGDVCMVAGYRGTYLSGYCRLKGAPEG